ncbi:Ectonucleoside triphosphate diphosphohydrolase 3 [Blomia tropicalis]|nr:Ectonucleoside triphosphate diphosphohydrolase 3 [Blomia tropicalis]
MVPFTQYAITIDAGSTHSKAILFKWRTDKLNGTGLIKQVNICHISRGIASYADEKIKEGADELMKCIEQLAIHLDNGNTLEHMFVYLGATAGMRMLNISNPNASANIFNVIRTRFIESGLQPKRISIITGKEEGLFAWVAVNYLSGKLFEKMKLSNLNNRTFGVLDMGGASAQIAHQINDDDDVSMDDAVRIRLYGRDYNIHAYSNFCFGAEQALKRYMMIILRQHINSNNTSLQVEAPCLPRGLHLSSSRAGMDNVCTANKNGDNQLTQLNSSNEYELVGTSNFDKCYQTVEQILDFDLCKRDFRFCFKKSIHPKRDTFFAISAYYYLTDVLNLKNDINQIGFAEYINETRKICESTRNELQNKTNLNQKYLTTYCFKLTYLHSTLTKVYNFNERTWLNLRFTNNVNGNYLGWVLGFMISESNSIPSESTLATIFFDKNLYAVPIIVFLLVFFASAICFGRQIRRNRTTMQSVQTMPLNEVA